MTQPFLNGLDLSEIFYTDAVRPLLDAHFPNLPYSAALIGHGSEILGFDTAQSTDHDWGPRVMLFLSEGDHGRVHAELDHLLRTQLPHEVAGFSTSFTVHESGSSVLTPSDQTEVNHRVQILTVENYFRFLVKCDPLNDMAPADWVKVPAMRLLMATAGRVFHDGLEQLQPIRQKLAYYPNDVWLYLLATQWSRIGQEEHFMGRCGQVGDDLGSHTVAVRLVNDLMRLCFLIERKYPPYIKWFGSAFGRLACASKLTPIFANVFKAGSWQSRQTHMSAAYEIVADMHNGLAITPFIETKVSQFHDRPFLVIHAEQFAAAVYDQIADEAVLKLPKYLGAIDQFVDSTDALHYLGRLEKVYR